MSKEDKHIQLNLSEDVEKIMCDYDLILRVNDEGTKFVAFDIFDYANQKLQCRKCLILLVISEV